MKNDAILRWRSKRSRPATTPAQLPIDYVFDAPTAEREYAAMARDKNYELAPWMRDPSLLPKRPPKVPTK